MEDPRLQQLRDAAADVERQEKELERARERLYDAIAAARLTDDPLSLTAVGRAIGISRQRVQQLVYRIVATRKQ